MLEIILGAPTQIIGIYALYKVIKFYNFYIKSFRMELGERVNNSPEKTKEQKRLMISIVGYLS